MRPGIESILHNVENHAEYATRCVHEFLDTEKAAVELIKQCNGGAWSSVSRATMEKRSASCQCPYRATTAGVESKLRYQDHSAQVAAAASAQAPLMQSSAHSLHDRQVNKGLRQGHLPSAKVERGCHTQAFWRQVPADAKDNAGKFEVGVFELHGARCPADPNAHADGVPHRRRPELSALVRGYLAANPNIAAAEVYTKVSQEHPDWDISAVACASALARVRGKVDAADLPSPTCVSFPVRLAFCLFALRFSHHSPPPVLPCIPPPSLQREELIKLLCRFAALGCFSATKLAGHVLRVPAAQRADEDESPAAYAVREHLRREKDLVIAEGVMCTALFLHDALRLLPFITVLACDACKC